MGISHDTVELMQHLERKRIHLKRQQSSFHCKKNYVSLRTLMWITCRLLGRHRGFNFTNPLVQSTQSVCRNQFHQQNFLQLYQYTQLEVMFNFYALISAPYTGELRVILLAQKLLIKWWLNQSQAVLTFRLTTSTWWGRAYLLHYALWLS